ncbi:MAG: hypothetical protein H7Z75_15350 [Ferruginibacter sp.]|nr:hypothetical protein [Cytophagales bacterium]
MKKGRVASWKLCIGALAVVFSGCKEQFFTEQERAAGLEKTSLERDRGGFEREGDGGFTDLPGGQRFPYPTITKKVFIPTNDLWAHTKCLTWKITWPAYPNNADPDRIPTVFSTGNGALNSFYFLNNTSQQNTYKAHFSLHHLDKVESANNMWAELTHAYGSLANMEFVSFAKTDFPANIIEGWVKYRPSHFEEYWPVLSDYELQYQEGDIILYKLEKQNLYGGIRIVSMNPRVIEVYLAVPNV